MNAQHKAQDDPNRVGDADYYPLPSEREEDPDMQRELQYEASILEDCAAIIRKGEELKRLRAEPPPKPLFKPMFDRRNDGYQEEMNCNGYYSIAGSGR